MLSAIRSRITYVNVVATLVLVFAMTGGAYAAKKYLITSTKQISPSVLKSLQGKAGAAGAAGVAGVAGAQGPAGPAGGKGDTGAAGKEGLAGKDGSPGKQGVTGAKGASGSPWTAGGTLPSKATETGVWSYGELPPENESYVPISFPIPLTGELSATQVHYINLAGQEVVGFNKEVTSTMCTGTAATPAAEPGNLCIYAGVSTAIQPLISSINILKVAGEEEIGASTAGAVIDVSEPENNTYIRGTWAVTAE